MDKDTTEGLQRTTTRCFSFFPFYFSPSSSGGGENKKTNFLSFCLSLGLELDFSLSDPVDNNSKFFFRVKMVNQ